MNQVVVEGNVVRDTLIRETAKGTKVCTVPIATNRYFRDMRGELQKETAFFDVEAWGENFTKMLAKMATKGRGLRVIGRLKQDRWKGQDGKSSSKTYILAEHIEFQFPKKDGNSDDKDKKNAELAAEGLRAEAEKDVISEDDFNEGGEAVF